MSDRPSIYAASPGDAAEVRRALRICLSGMEPPAALTFANGDFPAWVSRVFVPVLAPHAIRAHQMALLGDAAGLAEADRTLDLPPSSTSAGRDLLAARGGARYLPVARRFAGAVGNGAAAGHFATVMALHAADFSVALLPLLQCLLYCEWRAGQSGAAARGLEEFLHQAHSILPALRALLLSHAQNPDIPVARAL